MKMIRKWLIGKLTVNDLVEYFHSMGIGFNFTLEKNIIPEYYIKNSRIYRLKRRGAYEN